MKTLLVLLVSTLGLVGAVAQDRETKEVLVELSQRNDATGARARAMIANPILPGESREAWNDRIARAVEVTNKTWTPEKEAAYSVRYAARVQAEADARRSAEERDQRERLIQAVEGLRK